MDFFLNRVALSLNSVNSGNKCLAGAVVASWSLTQEVAGETDSLFS